MRVSFITLSQLTPGGIFKLELFLPEEYPMNPPKVRFLTKIYHPNIGELTEVCFELTHRQARPYLPRHPEGQVVARAPDPDRAPVDPGAARRAQPRRPARERRRAGVEGGPERRHRRGQAVDPAVRQVESSRVLYVALM